MTSKKDVKISIIINGSEIVTFKGEAFDCAALHPMTSENGTDIEIQLTRYAGAGAGGNFVFSTRSAEKGQESD